MQLEMTLAPRESKRDLILAALTERRGEWVGGEAFLDGRFGFRCSSYSQRIGQLIRAGHPIDRDPRGGYDNLGAYRLRISDNN